MDTKSKIIKILSALILSMLVICVPVAKNFHTIEHFHTENLSVEKISTKCSVCDFNFSIFDTTAEFILSKQIANKPILFVSLITKFFYISDKDTLIIRGPPSYLQLS